MSEEKTIYTLESNILRYQPCALIPFQAHPAQVQLIQTDIVVMAALAALYCENKVTNTVIMEAA